MPAGAANQHPERGYVTWQHCAFDAADHAVTDADFAAGFEQRQGRYQAICGHKVLVDSCLTPPGRVCPKCWALLAPPARQPAKTHAAHRALSRLRRLRRRLRSPAGSQPRPPQRARHPRASRSDLLATPAPAPAVYRDPA